MKSIPRSFPYLTLFAVTLALDGAAYGSAFGIITSAQTVANTGAGQNLPGATATYNSNTGATTQIVNGSGIATAGGTANVLGLTSSFDQSSASNSAPNLTASAYAAADLTTGSLRAMGSGNAINAALGQGVGTAELYDTLTFHVAGANNLTVTDFEIDLSLDGSVTQFGPGVSVLYTLTAPGSEVQMNYDAFQVTNSTPVVNQYGWLSENVISATPASFIFRGTTSGQGATFSVPIDLKLAVNCEGVTCDYSHTGLLNLVLPAGVTYTSASGVFLTQTSSAPEPASWALSLGSLAALVMFAKKRYRAIPRP